MKKQEATADFVGSQGDFILSCRTKQEFMERDAADFATRGVDANRLKAFGAGTAALLLLPSDDQLNYSKQEATAAAETQREVTTGGMATVMSQVAIKHDTRSPGYKAFGSAGLHNDSEGDFYTGMVHLLGWADAHAADYAAQGLTPAQLKALRAENEAYLALLTAKRLAESARATATQTRIQAYNAHNDELTALCGIGKGIYIQTDKTRYDDYVLDPAIHSAPGPVPVPPAG